MSATSIAANLPTFEDELFYAILDVALDIDQTLMVQSGNGPIYVDGVRDAIRYSILCPAISVDLMYRYADLRRKGLMFLQKQSAICSMEYHKWGISGWQGRWEITAIDVDRFGELSGSS